MKKYIILSLVIGSLSACFVDTIQPDELIGYQKKMVVNGVFTAGEGLAIELTTSEASIDSTFPRLIKDANVTLITTSGNVSMSYNVLSENYITGTALMSGESVALKIEHPSFPNVNSVVRFPVNINAYGVLIENGGIDTSGKKGDLLQVTFNDEAGKDNFYKINVYYMNTTLNQWIPINFDKRDPSLAEYNSYLLNDAGVLFSDELFNGNSKTISIVTTSGLVSSNPGDKYLIELSSITKDYFSYYRSLQRAQDAKEISFQGGYNNAVVIHSNIVNGLGILGATTQNNIVLK